MSDYGELIGATFGQQRQVGRAQAVGNIDADPMKAQRSLELSQATGISPDIINGDVENFEKMHKEALASDLVENNTYLQDYIARDPMHSKLSNDDYGNLDSVSQKMEKLGMKSIFQDMLDAFGEGYDAKAQAKEIRSGFEHPLMKTILSNPLFGGMSVALDTSMRFLTGATNAAQRGAEELGTRITGNPAWGRRFARDLGQGLQVSIPELAGVSGMPHFAEAWRQARQLKEATQPYLEAGKQPPYGTHPILDDLYRQESDLDLKNLDDALSEAQKSATRERNPDIFASFIRQHTDASIGIKGEKIAELYGDKVPHPEDGILGFVPDMAQQLEAARQTGADVHVPLADWLAKVDPQVAKELHDDIRVRPEGVTKSEVAEAPEIKPREPMQTPDSVNRVADQLRDAAGLNLAEGRDLRTLKMKKEGEPAKFPNDSVGHTFALVDQEGKDAGHLLISEHDEGKRLYVDEVFTREGPQAWGPKAVRDLLQQIKQEFPNAETLEGVRVSGARERAGVKGEKLAAGINLADEATWPKGWEVIEASAPGERFATASAKPGGEEYTYRKESAQPIETHKLGDLLDEVRTEHLEGVAKPLSHLLRPKFKEHLKGVDVLVMKQEDISRIINQDRPEKPTTRTPGFYDHRTHKIVLSDDLFNGTYDQKYASRVVMHEAVHAFTEHQLQFDPTFKSAIKDIMLEVDMFASRAVPELREKDIKYAFKNESEFVAEAFSNPTFQEVLGVTPITPELAKKMGLGEGKFTVWDAFKQAIKNILKDFFGYDVGPTALDAMLKLGEQFEGTQKEYNRARRESGLRAAEQPELPGTTRMEDREPFEKATAIGMTKESYQRWKAKLEERQAQDLEKAQARAMRDQERRLKPEWKAHEAEERKAAAQEVNQHPDVMSDDFFRHGEYLGKQMSTMPRLNPEFLTPEQQAGISRRMQAKKGLNPDDVAGLFGFATGKDMVDSMVAYQRTIKEAGIRPDEFKRKLITQETELRMRQKYGDFGEKVLEEAKDQVLSETQLDLIHEETLAAATMAKSEYPITRDQLMRGNKEIFDNLKARDVSSDSYLAAAGRAGKKGEEALLADKFQDFFKLKQQQQHALIMAHYAKQLEKEQASFEKTTKRFRDRQVKSVDQEYTDFIHDLMVKGGLGVKRSLQDIQMSMQHHGNTSLDNFVQAKYADGWDLAVSEEIKAGQVKPVEDMTTKEFMEYKDAIDSLAYVGREVKKINIAGEKLDFAEWKARALQNIRSLPKRSSKTVGLYGLDSVLGKMEEFVKDLDLRQEFGPLYAALIHPFELSKSKSHGMMKDLTERLRNLREGDPAWQKTLKDTIPNDFIYDPYNEVMFDLTRENMINIMLNFGTRSNIDKFTKAWAGAREGRLASKEEATAFEMRLRNLFDRHATKADWDYVQAIWDTFKPWQKEADVVYRNTSGKAPEWIPAEPLTTRHGEYAGGYFPIIYDKLRSNLGVIEDKAGGQPGTLGPDYFRATTANGYSKGRTGYRDFIDFDKTIDTLGLRMQQMIHDISFRDFVLQANKVLYDKEIRSAIRKHYGKEYEDQLIPWLKRIANNFNTDEKGLGYITNLLRATRINMISYALPYNYKVLFTPDIGALNPAAMTRFYTNYADNYKLAMEKSKEIPYLVYNLDRDFRDQLSQTVAKNGWKKFQATATEYGYLPVVKMSQQFRMVTFVDEYNKAIARGLPEVEASSIADSYVRQRHGSAHVGDLPSIMASNEGMKVFTMFYGYYNTMYNWQREIPGDLRRGDFKKAMQAFYGTMVIGTAFNALITPPKKDESWGHYIARITGTQALGTLPFLRDAANLALEGNDPRSPWSSLIKSWWNVANDGKRFFVDKKPVQKGVKHATEAVGMSVGLPGAAQFGRTGQFFYDVANNRQKPRNFYEWIRGITAGEAQPKR